MRVCRNCDIEPENDNIKHRGWCPSCIRYELGDPCKTTECPNGTFNANGYCDDCETAQVLKALEEFNNG